MNLNKIWKNGIIAISIAVSLLSLSAQSRELANERWVRNQEAKISKLAKDGDILFQYFTGDLSLVIEEVQKTQWTHVGIMFKEKDGWYVYEAVGPVVKTPLRDFLRETRDQKVSLTRVHSDLVDFSKRSNVTALKKSFKPYEGIDYDYLFQWSDDVIYCSELVYKMFHSTFGIEIGAVQKVGELDLSGPLAQQLVAQLIEYVDPETYLEEPIVTPGSQILDSDLSVVYDSTVPEQQEEFE